MDLAQLRADQHDDLDLASDHALHAFLTSCDPAHVARDRTPTTRIERRMLRSEAGS